MANQEECAQWIQANEKLGILTSGDDLIPNEETGDIATWAKLNNLDRVPVFYHPDARLADASVDALAAIDPIPEAAYFGKMPAKRPGSATWKFRELQSVPTYEGKQQSLAASFLKAQIIMGAAQKVIGSAFSFVRDSVIGATAETERYRVVIGSLIGDQEKANQAIRDLDYSPVSDFYGTAAAIGGLRSFVTMGMDIDKAKGQMTLLGDVAQGNSEAFNSLSANMAQVYSKGKADAMDLKQFMAQGFDVSGVLGLTEAQKKAGVTYAQVEEALKRVTAAGGPYNNMLAKQMNTLGGVLKQFASFKAATAESIGTEINKELKDLLKNILEIAKAGQKTFVGTFVSALKTVIHWIYQIIITFEILQYRIEDAGLTFEPLKQLAASFSRAVESAISGIFPFMVELGKLIVAAFGPIQAFASPIIEELGRIVRDVFIWLADRLSGIVPMELPEWHLMALVPVLLVIALYLLPCVRRDKQGRLYIHSNIYEQRKHNKKLDAMMDQMRNIGFRVLSGR